MTKEELSEIKLGDHLWLCDVQIAGSRERLLHRATFVELKYKEPGSYKGRYIFEVVQKISGSIKIGDIVIYGVYSKTSCLYRTYEEAKEEWNRKIYNALDYNQAKYEEVKKRFESKLIKK